jgi:glycosyltransferase involved in cell wall biosynthesis
MHHTLHDLVTRQPFEAIHADQLWMAQYALAAKRYHDHSNSLKTTLDQHNAVYLIPKRLTTGTSNPLKRAILTLESRHMARYEVETCRQFDHVVWVTAEDQAAVARQYSGATGEPDRIREHVIPICIDPEAKAVIPQQPQARRVTFLGGLHWPPNAEGIVWFANEVWPHVRQQIPDAVLTVIGKDPPRQLNGRLEDGLETTGYVDDPGAYLAKTAAFIVPLHAGGGMRVKILDAWSWGLPIVSTTIGAEGIHYRDGENLLIADSAGAFAQAVIRLLREPAVADRLAAAGRRTVETEYDWRQVYREWDLIYSRKRLTPPLA